MIEFDQPKIFGDRIVAKLSSAEDGDMKFGTLPDSEVSYNREVFLNSVEIDPLQTTLIKVSYEDNTDFTRYLVLNEEHLGEGVLSPVSRTHADAVVVTRPGHAVLLPLADCVGAIVYDPNEQIMMVSHLGRHSLEQNGAAKSIDFLVDEFGSDPDSLIVWLSPAAGKEDYPLRAFDNRGLIEVTGEQMLLAGINSNNIEVSSIDTTISLDYFSHSQYLAGERDNDGRFAVVAMMTD